MNHFTEKKFGSNIFEGFLFHIYWENSREPLTEWVDTPIRNHCGSVHPHWIIAEVLYNYYLVNCSSTMKYCGYYSFLQWNIVGMNTTPQYFIWGGGGWRDTSAMNDCGSIHLSTNDWGQPPYIYIYG